jgi:hypothetical protein
MPANRLIAGTQNSCPGTRMARSYSELHSGVVKFMKHQGQKF